MWRCPSIFPYLIAHVGSLAMLELQLLTTETREMTIIFRSATSSEPLLKVTNELTAGDRLKRFRIDASMWQRYWVTIVAGGSPEYGIRSTIVNMALPARRLSVAPEKVMPPLKGLLIFLICQNNWYGDKCDVFCDELVANINNRTCHTSGVYQCPSGLKGVNCTETINASDCDCKNGGSCQFAFTSSKEEEGHLVCVCPEGRGGKTCEEDAEVAIRLSTFSTFTAPIPANVTVDEYYASKMIPNTIGARIGKTFV